MLPKTFFMTMPLRAIIFSLLWGLRILCPAAVDAADRDITVLAVGDVMLGRHIAKVMNAGGSDFPFREIAPAFRNADVVFGNLEAVIAEDGSLPAFPEKPYNFHAHKAAAPALGKAGFHVLSLANNHAMDYGPAALFETRRLLDKSGISTFGAGKDISEARRPTILIKNGVRFGFLGYGVAHSRAVYARKNRPGIAPVIMNDIQKDIRAVRSAVDVLIVSLHWGIEYEHIPSKRQREEARQIIDWGADMILGHHPHVMQGIEIYKGKIVAYSLGNFIFDQKGKGTDRSFILACRFREKALYSAEIIPLDRFRRYFPRVAEGAVRKTILEDVRAYSLPINSEPAKLSLVGL
jgi:poly-gamma-glutamate synthesis protein (capsule biosynthesis protein)